MLSDHNILWTKTLDHLQQKMNKQTFNNWFKETKALSINDDTLVVLVPDDIAEQHISNHYLSTINTTLSDLSGKKIFCELTTKEVSAPSIQNKDKPFQQVSLFGSLSFNPNYTFDTFVIGPNNEFAHAAALSVSHNPAGQYNPLFIYGDSGLGKTHLLQAIGNTISKEKPYLKVIYVTCEQFISEFIHAVMSGTTQSMKIKYRNVDILLIDDIQFLSSKDQTQEEFFHTFNELHVNKKQIVLTSDRPPKELQQLTDRLRTRFQSGLLADIKAPTLETREAILKKKAALLNLDLSDEITNYMARRIKSDIRSLESALINLQAITTLKKVPPSIELIKHELKHLFETQQSREVSIDEIITKVASRYNVSSESIKSKSRHASIIQPRFVSMYLSTKLTQMTTIQIGKEFGNRDHSTVINARNNIESLIKEDENLKDIVDDIISDLKN